MIDAPDWLVYGFDLLMFVVIIFGLVFLRAWWNVRLTKGRIIAEIWEPSGFATRVMVKPEPNGHTVNVDHLEYRLPKELSEREFEKETAELKKAGKPISQSHTYPRRRWVYRPNWPMPSIPMRIESWERDNPEPIRPFYGRVDKDGKFIDSQLTVTSTEWQAQKSVIQATGIAMSVQEREAREKEWARAMANLPNKMIIYIGLGALLLLSVISLLMMYQG